MSLKWPFKLMEVGDYAVIFGLPVGKVKQYACTYGYVSGFKFESRKRKLNGREAVIVRRIHDNGAAPIRNENAQVFYMDAKETMREDRAKVARREMARREALGDNRGRLLLNES